MDRTEPAWAAGFWDGEGSAYLSGSSDRATKYPQARINQASTTGVPEVLIRFQRAVGFGRLRGPDLAEGREPLYRWEVTNRIEVLETLNALDRYLGHVKRSRFHGVLRLPAPPPRAEPGWDPDAERAWSAGLFDGEGSTYLVRHRSHAGYFVLEAAITQSSWSGVPEVLERFQRIFAIGKIYGPYPGSEGHAPVYRWKCHRRDQIEAMIAALGTELGRVKRAQAAQALGVVAAQLPLPRGNPAWGNRKTHCIRGHEYATARMRPFKGRGKNERAPRESHHCLVCLRQHAERKRRERGQNERRPGGRRS